MKRKNCKFVCFNEQVSLQPSFPSFPQTPHRHHINAVIHLIREISSFLIKLHQINVFQQITKTSILLFGNLARFHLGTWHDFIWEFGRFLFGNLAKSGTKLHAFPKCKRINLPIPPNYRTFVRQIIAWTASYLAVTRSDDKDSPEPVESLNLKF